MNPTHHQTHTYTYTQTHTQTHTHTHTDTHTHTHLHTGKLHKQRDPPTPPHPPTHIQAYTHTHTFTPTDTRSVPAEVLRCQSPITLSVSSHCSVWAGEHQQRLYPSIRVLRRSGRRTRSCRHARARWGPEAHQSLQRATQIRQRPPGCRIARRWNR